MKEFLIDITNEVGEQSVLNLFAPDFGEAEKGADKILSAHEDYQDNSHWEVTAIYLVN